MNRKGPIDMERCKICGVESHDLRTLRMRYFYDLSEISDKLTQERVLIALPNTASFEDTMYSVRTCKDCRGDFMQVLKHWLEGKYKQPEPTAEHCIPYRKDGRTVMLTEAEFAAITKTP